MKPTIKVRKLPIVLTQESVANWAQDPFVTAFFNAISSILTLGEQVFINSVRSFQRQITDETLSSQIKEFLKQEAHHNYLHEKYNDLLAAQGYKIKRMNRVLQSNIYFYTRIFSSQQWLAFTVAFEQITATLGEYLFATLQTDNWEKNYLTLWQLHFTEEIEHKAVAFDVYQTVDGSYWRRIIAMFFVLLSFAGKITYRTIHLLHREKQLWKWKTWKSGWCFLFGWKGFAWKMLQCAGRYLRPGYHPWQYDNYSVVTQFDRTARKY